MSADRWTIRGRVTQKSNIRNWCNSRGEGKLFNMTIVDESGEIRATGFNAECEKFYNLIEMNKVTSYLIVCSSIPRHWIALENSCNLSK